LGTRTKEKTNNNPLNEFFNSWYGGVVKFLVLIGDIFSFSLATLFIVQMKVGFIIILLS